MPVEEKLLKEVYFTARRMTLTTRVSGYGSYSPVKNGLCWLKCLNTHAIEKSARWQHTRAYLHIFIETWRVARLSCPLASFRTCLPEMSHWILNMWTNLMMAGTQSAMALIIHPSAVESWRPPQGLRHLRWTSSPQFCCASLFVAACLLSELPNTNVFRQNVHCHWHKMLIAWLQMVKKCR